MAALISAADLGIDTTTDQGLFDWLLASLLFGPPCRRRPPPAHSGSSRKTAGTVRTVGPAGLQQAPRQPDHALDVLVRAWVVPGRAHVEQSQACSKWNC
jgi:hypothetical protein